MFDLSWSSLFFIYSLFCYHPRHCLWFIPFTSPLCSFPTLTYSRFDISLASFLRISLSIWFASSSHYWYYIHIGHPQVHGSWAFLCMLQFIHEGMVFYHWVFGPSFLSFLLPYHPGLYYVMCLKTTWGHGIWCRLRQPLHGQVFEIWLIFRYHHASSSGKLLFDVWTWFSCGYGWLGLHLWWWMIQCCPIFRFTIHMMLHWGIFSFRLRFINLHGVACSFPLTRYTLRQWHVCYLITIS